MTKSIAFAIILALLLSCGGASDPVLAGVKIELKGKRYDNAYSKLSEGLYSPAGQKENLKKIPEAWFEMAKLHKRRGENKKALAALETTKKLDIKKKYIDKVEKSKKIWANQDYKNAISAYNKSISLKGDEKKKELNSAKDLLKSSNTFNEQSDVYSLLGKTFEQLNEIENAESAYKSAIALEDTNPTYLFNLASLYFNNKKYEDAIEAFDKTLALDSKHKNALKFKAFAYQNNQKLGEAVAAYKALLAVYPDDEDGLTNLKSVESIHLIMKANDLINQFNKVRNSKPKQAKAYLRDCASILEEAVESELHKENADIWETLSIVYANLGMKKAAKRATAMTADLRKN